MANKYDLAKEISNEVNVSLDFAVKMIEAYHKGVVKLLKENPIIRLNGFGTYEIRRANDKKRIKLKHGVIMEDNKNE